MADPLDDIAYLVGSRNRVRVLRFLGAERADRRTIHEETGISRATLSRVLSGLEERGWITQRGSECAITPIGELLVDEFTSFVDAVGTIQRLEGAIEYLQLDEIGVDLSHLRDAVITTPNQHDPSATLRRATELVREADEFRFLTNAVASPTAEALGEQTVRGELSFVGVITDALFEAIRSSPEFSAMTREMIESGRAEFYRYDGTVSQTLGLADGTLAVMTQIGGNGNLHAQIETDDKTVRQWVASTIEEHRPRAEPIPVEAFTG